MSIDRPMEIRAIRFLAMALIALAPMLFSIDATPWGTDLAAAPAAHDVQPTEQNDDERNTASAEAEPALPNPAPGMTRISQHVRAMTAAKIYLPPDTLPLLPPPRPMMHS